jgi:Inner membrane protein YgaP-like, transmembrane domain
MFGRLRALPALPMQGAGASRGGKRRMNKTVGKVDRVVRVVVAATLIFLTATPAINGGVAYGFLAVAAYLLISALTGHCLIYRMIGIESDVHGGEYHSGPTEAD